MGTCLPFSPGALATGAELGIWDFRISISNILAVSAVVVFTPAISAQYFGQNKVRFETCDFKVLRTEHFDIYFYETERDAAAAAGRMAERWYSRLNDVLGHSLSSRQPIVLYASQAAFRATTAIPGEIGEGTGGVTTLLRRKLVMPLAGPLSETNHVLGHELVHAFQFDISADAAASSERGGSVVSLPLWFVEGMAEYLSLGALDPFTAMWMRDAVARNRLPSLGELNSPRYFPYRYGQAFWAYLAGCYGDGVIAPMLRVASAQGVNKAIKLVLDTTPEALSAAWRRSLSDSIDPVLKLTVPAEEDARLLVSRKRNGGELNVAPALSPDGSLMMFFSQRGLFSMELYLADGKTGAVKRKITESAAGAHSESLEFINSAGAWSADGRLFAFGGVADGRPQLAIYDAGRRRVTRRFVFDGLGTVLTPTWSPDGRRIAFSATRGGYSDLAVIDIDTGRWRMLTRDAFADLQPAWSPGGRTIAFTTDRFTTDIASLSFGHYQLALLDVASGDIARVPAFAAGNHINPQWAQKGQALYFISDWNGIANVYRLERRGGEISQITRLQSGVTGVTRLSPALSVAASAGRLAFSTFGDGEYSIYSIDDPIGAGVPLDLAKQVDELKPAVLPPLDRPAAQVLPAAVQPPAAEAEKLAFSTHPYKPKLGLDYIAPPNVGVSTGGFGAFAGGGTALYWSDMLGYHSVTTAFQLSGSTNGSEFLRGIAALGSYENRMHRWTWGVAGGQVPLLTGSIERTVRQADGETTVVEGVTRYWRVAREGAAAFTWPFNRAQRIELAGGFRRVDFSIDRTENVYRFDSGRLISRRRSTPGAPRPLNLGITAAALVYDTALFGGASPVRGRRYRLELGGNGGTLIYTTALADFRQYVMLARPLSLAGRLLHYGRYGGGARDERLEDLYIGYPSLVRGYDAGSFTSGDCGSTPGVCPVFDRLIGRRVAVANAEIRLQVIGALGVIGTRHVPPVEVAPFFDSGIAWGRNGGGGAVSNAPVRSTGVSARVNLFGFAVGQLSYVHPLDRPARSWLWEFAILPGF